MEGGRRENGQNTINTPISPHSSFLQLHLSFSPSQLSLALSPTRALPPLCGCLFRLGRDKWKGMNTLRVWGSMRAECGGGGGRGNMNLSWLTRKENKTLTMVTCYEWQSLWMVYRKSTRVGYLRREKAIGWRQQWDDRDGLYPWFDSDK